MLHLQERPTPVRRVDAAGPDRGRSTRLPVRTAGALAVAVVATAALAAVTLPGSSDRPQPTPPLPSVAPADVSWNAHEHLGHRDVFRPAVTTVNPREHLGHQDRLDSR